MLNWFRSIARVLLQYLWIFGRRKASVFAASYGFKLNRLGSAGIVNQLLVMIRGISLPRSRNFELIAYEVELHLCACQGRPSRIRRESMTGVPFIALQCRSCGKKTATFETEEEAIEEWNGGKWREL